MNNSLINHLKSVQIDILINFIKVCEEHSLQYFLIGGSCLGAVRHGGYIPWDDDIDVGMPREDYNRFAEIANQKLPRHLFFQTSKTDPEYPNIFGKIRNSETTFIETSSRNLKINHGVYIDVFPLDGISDNILWRKMILFKIRIYNSCIIQCFDKSLFSGLNPLKVQMYKILWKLNPDIKNIIDKREKLACKYSYASSKYIANHGGAWGNREVMPKNIFGKGKKVCYEGINALIPEKYDEYLTRLYGDYMSPPPPEKRVGHHYYDVADMNKSYVEYIKEK